MTDDYKGNPVDLVHQLAADLGGTVQEVGVLPDGSGFATMSMPLPKTHWIFAETAHYEAPPMVLRTGTAHAQHAQLQDLIVRAGRYAVRAATMNGKEMDFDPDALVQNLVVALLGYHTPSGLTQTGDDWANPKPTPPRVVHVEWEQP